MPVAIVMDFEGATLDQYDQVMEKMGLAGSAPIPAGALFHWVAATEGGIRVTDVWETQEGFDAFAAERIMPSAMEVGIPNPPTVVAYPVHNLLAPS